MRVFGIGATAADVVAVLRRGPSGWCHVGRWDIAAWRYEPGSWLHGTLYPQRCDLSADGRYLCYFALEGNSTWELGDTYIAISRRVDPGPRARPLRGPVAIAEYLGASDAFDRLITDFSLAYADQNEEDDQEFVNAVQSGRLQRLRASENQQNTRQADRQVRSRGDGQRS